MKKNLPTRKTTEKLLWGFSLIGELLPEPCHRLIAERDGPCGTCVCLIHISKRIKVIRRICLTLTYHVIKFVA